MPRPPGALLVGAALGCFRAPPKRLTAGMLAFAAGALIVAVAFELFEPAHRQAGLARASAALVVGAATFIAADLLIQRFAGAEAAGLALVAAVTLDGVPENLALGVGLARERLLRAPRRDRRLEPARGVRRRRHDARGRASSARVLSARALHRRAASPSLSSRAGSPRTSHPMSGWDAERVRSRRRARLARRFGDAGGVRRGRARCVAFATSGSRPTR